jgi:hypothetical protein
MIPPSRMGGVATRSQTDSSVPRRRQISSAAQSAFVVQSCSEPIGQVAAHFAVSVAPRAPAASRQQTPLVQLLVPEQASLSPMQAAAVVHLRVAPPAPPPPTQHTSVAESHGVAPQAI